MSTNQGCQNSEGKVCACFEIRWKDAWIAALSLSDLVPLPSLSTAAWLYFRPFLTLPFKAYDLLYFNKLEGDLLAEWNSSGAAYGTADWVKYDNQHKALLQAQAVATQAQAISNLHDKNDKIDIGVAVSQLASFFTYYGNVFGFMFDSAALWDRLNNKCKCDPCGNDPDEEPPKLVMSPIILDLDGDTSNDVTPLADSAAYFDMKSWGVANRTGWVSPTDGLLVWDRNGNGSIDDSSELFGNTESVNGFEQLRKYFDTNKDGVVDANDTNFGELKVWIDANSNGITEEGELKSLEELGIASINLGYTNTSGSQCGESIASGTYTKTDGTTGEANDYLFDVSLRNTEYRGEYTIGEDFADLIPNFCGFGSMKDLHVAMALDDSLYNFVKDNITDADTLSANFDELMMRWSGLYAKHQQLGINSNGQLRFMDMIWILAQMAGDTKVTDAELISNSPARCYIVKDNTDNYNNLKRNYSEMMFALADGRYITDADYNYLVQQITAFGRDNGVSFTSANDVRQNDYIRTLIANSWKQD